MISNKSSRRRLSLGAAFLLPLAAFCADAPPIPALSTHTRTIKLQFSAGFLKPTTAARSPKKQMLLGVVRWISPTAGVVPVQMWQVNSVVQFTTVADRQDRFESLSINPIDQGGSIQLWEVWRHRHGYLYDPNRREYVWNSLDDDKEALPPGDGVFYDQFLKEIWTFWTLKKLPAHLKDPAAENVQTALTNGEALFTEPVKVTYDANGLKEPFSFSTRIYVWDVPVLLSFRVQPATTTANGQVTPITYKARWTFDMGDWRDLHGYHKDFWGYSWDKDFPQQTSLSTEQGKKLDALLDRCVSFWVEIIGQQLMTDLEYKIAAALPEP